MPINTRPSFHFFRDLPGDLWSIIHPFLPHPCNLLRVDKLTAKIARGWFIQANQTIARAHHFYAEILKCGLEQTKNLPQSLRYCSMK